MQDEALLRLLRCDPPAGLQAAMDAYMGLVLAVARGRLGTAGTPEDAEECAADVFCVLYQKSADIDPAKGSLRAWLCAVAKNRAIDLCRRRLARGGAPPVELEAAETLVPPAPSAEEEHFTAHQRQVLLQAVQGLGETDREIIMRKYYIGQPSKEIAPLVGLSPGAVDTRAHRAVARLRRQMEDENNG